MFQCATRFLGRPFVAHGPECFKLFAVMLGEVTLSSLAQRSGKRQGGALWRATHSAAAGAAPQQGGSTLGTLGYLGKQLLEKREGTTTMVMTTTSLLIRVRSPSISRCFVFQEYGRSLLKRHLAPRVACRISGKDGTSSQLQCDELQAGAA